MSRSAVVSSLKILVSLALLLFLLSRIDIAGLLLVLASARPSYLVVVLMAYLVGQVISALRWTLIARPLGYKNPFKDFAVFYFIGMFFNLFAPGIVGGDVGRVFYLARGGGDADGGEWKGRAGTALTSVVADRSIGMAVLVWIGASALLIFPAYALPLAVRYLTFALALVIFVGWLLLPVLSGFIRRRENPWTRNLLLAAEAYSLNRQVIATTILLSVVVHSAQAVSHALVGWSLDLDLSWSYYFILYPLVSVFSAIPLSFNGIGLREGGYLFLLQRMDVDPEKAMAFGLLWFGIVMLEGMIGGVVFISSRSPKPSPVVPDAEIRSGSG